MNKIRKVRNFLPPEFFIEWPNSPVHKFLDCEILREHDWNWIGREKNVHGWIEFIYQGKRYALAWNENPARGWSFPHKRMKT